MNIPHAVPYVAEGPQPLIREIPRGDYYPVNALGPLKAAVEAVQATTQAPAAIAAQSALSVASLVVQAHADVESLAGFVPLSLFCLTIAQSGERKSGCDKLVMSGLREFERGRASDYRADMAEWSTDQKLWSAKHARAMHSSSRIGVGYNIQIAVDTKHKLIAEQQVHNKVSDLGFAKVTKNAAPRS